MDFLSFQDWLWLILAAWITGFSKTGISGMTLLAVPIVAFVLGAKASTGLMLPMLIAGDLFAVKAYREHADWKKIGILMPWTLLGLVLGLGLGSKLSEASFKVLLALIVLLCLVLMLWAEWKGENLKVPKSKWLYVALGIACGFTSMIGNAAGPLMSLYLLAMGYSKKDFLGTTALFFMLLNVSKVPLQAFVWQNLSWETLKVTLLLMPAIALGAWTGIWIIKKLPDRLFKYAILLVTAFAAFKLMWG